MSKRLLLVAAAEALLALCAFSVLFALGLARVDPIVWVGNPSNPQFHQHGMPTFSWVGAAVWIALIALYAYLATAAGVRIISLPQRRSLATGAPLLFLLTSLLIAVVHPTLLLTVLSPGARATYSRFIEKHIPVLDQIYFHWGLTRFKYLILLAQVIITLAVLGTLLLASGRARRWPSALDHN